MNKILSLSLTLSLAALSLTSCLKTEEDDIFDQSAAERLNEASDLYSGRLEDSKGGWIMQYYATTDTLFPRDNGYVMLAKFGTDNSVDMAMNNTFSSNKFLEETSAWDVITDDGPVLTFNTYNHVIHAFSNPEDLSQTSDDETGKGAQGDYEFVMVQVPEDGNHIMLKGKKRGAYTYMTRLPEGTDFEEYMTDIKDFTNTLFPTSAPNSFRLCVGDSTYVVNFMNQTKAMTTMYPLNGDPILQLSRHPNVITKRADGKYYVRFRDAIKGKDDVTAQDFVYDESADRFVDVDNSSNYLEAEDMMSFFTTNLNGHHTFTLNRTTGSISDKVKAVLDDIYTTYHKSNSKYGVNVYSFLTDADGNFIIKCRYNQSDSKTELQYKYNVTFNGEEMKLEYVEPVNDKSTSHLTRVTDAIQGIFSQTFKVSAMYSKFNLSNLKLTSTSDPDCWFEITY